MLFPETSSEDSDGSSDITAKQQMQQGNIKSMLHHPQFLLLSCSGKFLLVENFMEFPPRPSEEF